MQPKPFVKWEGGKARLLPFIMQLVPDEIAHYWEPFVGGGALFCELFDRVQHSNLSDMNRELMIGYLAVKKHRLKLINRLCRYRMQHDDEDFYYWLRDDYEASSVVEVASRFIYLNKTGYNGKYRVNKKGHFNNSRGQYVNPTICDAQNIYALSDALKYATLRHMDFENIRPTEYDFVFCDPPYYNRSKYTLYTPYPFEVEDQKRLRDMALEWDEKGANVMLCNNDDDLIWDLYDGDFFIYEVDEYSGISRDTKSRKSYNTLVITNYEK